MDDPQTLWGRQAGPFDLIMQQLSDLQSRCHEQSYTAVQIRAQRIDRKIDTSSSLVHALSILSQTAPDDDAHNRDEVACQADGQTVYPHIHGIDSTLVREVMDLRLSGMSWSAIALQTGKNYSRIIKPIRDAHTKREK